MCLILGFDKHNPYQTNNNSEDGGEIKMSSTSAFATAAVEDEFWAKPMAAKDGVTVGMTLLGNPQVFGSKGAESAILNKVRVGELLASC